MLSVEELNTQEMAFRLAMCNILYTQLFLLKRDIICNQV